MLANNKNDRYNTPSSKGNDLDDDRPLLHKYITTLLASLSTSANGWCNGDWQSLLRPCSSFTSLAAAAALQNNAQDTQMHSYFS
jgi:hypothetical protein